MLNLPPPCPAFVTAGTKPASWVLYFGSWCVREHRAIQMQNPNPYMQGVGSSRSELTGKFSSHRECLLLEDLPGSNYQLFSASLSPTGAL